MKRILVFLLKCFAFALSYLCISYLIEFLICVMFMFVFCRRRKQVEASVCVVGLLPSWVVGRLVVGGEGGGGDLLSKQTGEHSMYEYKKHVFMYSSFVYFHLSFV